MIDFSCCEVNKAVKTLFADNEVQAVNPIIKSYGQPFSNDGKTVYYGRFTNPQEGHAVSYRGTELANDDWTLFNKVENPVYDFFQGYAIKLKNVIVDFPVQFSDSNLIDGGSFENNAASLYMNYNFDLGLYPLVKLSFSGGDYIIMKSNNSGGQPYTYYPNPIYIGDYIGQTLRFQCLTDALANRRFAIIDTGGDSLAAGYPFKTGLLDFEILIDAGTNYLYPHLNAMYA